MYGAGNGAQLGTPELQNYITSPSAQADAGSKANALPLLISVAHAAQMLGVSASTVRQLISSGRIAHVRLGASKRMLPTRAIEQFINENVVSACPAETPAIDSAISRSAVPTTSFGPKADAAASEALVLMTVQRLKSRSRNSSRGGRPD